MAESWEEAKARGNESFKVKQWDDAISAYTAALAAGPPAVDQATLLANRAAAALKKEDWSMAVEDATACLTLDADNVKALFRRATAYDAMDKRDEAVADYKALLKARPGLKEAVAALKRLAPDELPRRKPMGKVSEEDMRILAELETRLNDVQRQVMQATERKGAAGREGRTAAINRKALAELPEATPMYSAVGKAYIASSRDAVLGGLDQTMTEAGKREEVIQSLLGRLDERKKEAQTALLEHVQAVQRGGSA